MPSDRKKVVVVVPFYKEALTDMEKLSLSRTGTVLKRYEIVFLAPEGLDLTEGRRIVPVARECRMKPDFFEGFAGYNRLMMSEDLYRRFEDYEYVLICQQDVFVIEDKLDMFLTGEWDYIGAPIPHMGPWSPKLYSGNGGFSLRSVDAVLRLLDRHGSDRESFKENEDVFYANAAERYPVEFRIAPVEIGLRFAFNMYYEKLYQRNGDRLPMAIHGFTAGDERFIRRHLEPLCDGMRILNENDWSKELETVYAFMTNAKHLLLYGAGIGGTVFLELAKRKGIEVDGFLVSDGQPLPENEFGVPAYRLSEYPGNWAESDVIITISIRYGTFPDFVGMVREKGARNVMQMTNEMYHAGIGELI